MGHLQEPAAACVGAPGAVDVCLGQEKVPRAEMGPLDAHLRLRILLLRECMERGQWQWEQPLCRKRGVRLLRGPVGSPQGRGALHWGAPALARPLCSSAFAALPLPTWLLGSPKPDLSSHLPLNLDSLACH